MFRDRNELIEDAVSGCLELMYQYSVPSMSFKDFVQNVKDGKEYDKSYFSHHYLPKELQDEIIDRVRYIYGLGHFFKEYTNVLKDDLMGGGLSDTYVEDKIGLSHRESEKNPPLRDIVGEDNAKKVSDLIDKYISFYRIDNSFTGGFDYAVFNYAPSNFKEKAEEYWKEKGFNYSFDDDDIISRYYKEEYDEDINEGAEPIIDDEEFDDEL